MIGLDQSGCVNGVFSPKWMCSSKESKMRSNLALYYLFCLVYKYGTYFCALSYSVFFEIFNCQPKC